MNKMKMVLGLVMWVSQLANAAPAQLNEGVVNTVSLNRQGLGIILGHSQSAMPVGAIYDRERYYPEIQEAINKKIKESSIKGFTPTSYETKTESQVFTLSKNNYEMLIISGFTMNAQGEKVTKDFIVPIERLLSDIRGPKAKEDVVYWQRLDVITLDSLSESETRLK